jgi:hypothetical protein
MEQKDNKETTTKKTSEFYMKGAIILLFQNIEAFRRPIEPVDPHMKQKK